MNTETAAADLKNEIATLDAWHFQAQAESLPTKCRACYATLARESKANPNSFNHGVKCTSCHNTRNTIALNSLRFMWVSKNNARKVLALGNRSEQSYAKHLAEALKNIELNAASYKSHT